MRYVAYPISIILDPLPLVYTRLPLHLDSSFPNILLPPYPVHAHTAALQMSSDDIRYPTGFGLNDVVAWGSSGLVVVDEDSETVIKTPFDHTSEWCRKSMAIEQQIYERLAQRGPHEGILSYYGTFDSGIRIEYAHNHDIQSYIENHHVLRQQVIVWARQVAEAIYFIHQAGVIHGDITCANILLDRNLNAKLADFAGSSLDGKPLLVAIKASHKYPGPPLNIQADLFAFGSALYHMISAHTPFEGFSDEEIDARFSRGEFPDTTSFQDVGVIVNQCWQGGYLNGKTIIADLKNISASTQ